MAQPLASLLPPGEIQLLDNNGVPLAGGSVSFFIPNTTSPKTTWQDSQEMTPNSNPVILDAGGRATVYGSGEYTMKVEDALGNLIYTAETSDLLFYFSLPATTRIALSAPANFYVATTGSNSNNGTALSPWQTLQFAANYVQNFIDTQGFSVTINVADGTYGAGVTFTGQLVGNGVLTLLGDVGSPASCVISTTNDSCIVAKQGAGASISGFKLTTTVSGNCLLATDGGRIFIAGPLNFGSCDDAHVASVGAGSEIVNIFGSYTISGSAVNHYTALSLALIYMGIPADTVTLTGTPAFTNFANVDNQGLLIIDMLFSGSATGAQYSASDNAVINTVNTFPGNSTGTLTSGGIYNGQQSSLVSISSLGTFSSLKISWASNSTATVTANQVLLQNSTFAPHLATGVSLTLNTAASGANGLDTGSTSASTWYYIYVIYNGSTVASLMSTSSTAPTLPSGYTYSARVGTLRLDGSKNIIGFVQWGGRTQWVVGQNLSGYLQMAQGSSGYPTSISVGSFVPTTAASIQVLLTGGGQNGTCAVGSNSTFNAGEFDGGNDVNSSIVMPVDVLLEGDSIYYGANGETATIYALGYGDNL